MVDPRARGSQRPVSPRRYDPSAIIKAVRIATPGAYRARPMPGHLWPAIIRLRRRNPRATGRIITQGGERYPAETCHRVMVKKNFSQLVTGREGFRVTHGNPWYNRLLL